jgi:hypothetical protein
MAKQRGDNAPHSDAENQKSGEQHSANLRLISQNGQRKRLEATAADHRKITIIAAPHRRFQ